MNGINQRHDTPFGELTVALHSRDPIPPAAFVWIVDVMEAAERFDRDARRAMWPGLAAAFGLPEVASC